MKSRVVTLYRVVLTQGVRDGAMSTSAGVLCYMKAQSRAEKHVAKYFPTGAVIERVTIEVKDLRATLLKLLSRDTIDMTVERIG